VLRSLVEQLGTDSWSDISHRIPGRTPRQCRDRYSNYLLDSLCMNPWTPEEDAIICQQFREIGPHWVQIAVLLNGRSGNHVKNRWHKHLSKLDSSLLAYAVAQAGNESEKPVINLCEAIGVNDCDLAALFTQLEGEFPFTWVSAETCAQGDNLL
jgi:hypothetical protein